MDTPGRSRVMAFVRLGTLALPLYVMVDKKRARWRRILSVAYSRPLATRWRRDTVSVFPGWLFDSLVVVLFVTLGVGLFFGLPGVLVTLLIPLPLFIVMENTKKVATKANASSEAPAAEAAPQVNDSSGRGPIWDDTSGRVRVAIWRNIRDDRSVRYSTSISRSYQDENRKWHNVHFFEEQDLGHVVAAAKLAIDQLDRFKAREAA